MELEEVGQPEYVLHQVNIIALLFLIPARPKHLVRVHKVEDDSESLRSGPKWEEDTDLLGVVDAFDDIAELL